MASFNSQGVINTAGFHLKYVRVLDKIKEFKTLWDNLILVASAHLHLNKNVLERQVEELKRFLMLKAFAGDVEAEVISPSSVVDELWHIVLTFTKDYAALCDGILTAVGARQKFIHHNPLGSLPGDEENKRIRYRNTLALYNDVFGEAGPVDIWPADTVRSNAPREVENSSSNQRIPAAILTAIPIATPIHEVTLNINWTRYPERVAHCKVPRTLQMKKLFDDFMHDTQTSNLSFYLNDKKIKPTDTPESLDWVDGEVIIAK